MLEREPPIHRRRSWKLYSNGVEERNRSTSCASTQSGGTSPRTPRSPARSASSPELTPRAFRCDIAEPCPNSVPIMVRPLSSAPVVAKPLSCSTPPRFPCSGSEVGPCTPRCLNEPDVVRQSMQPGDVLYIPGSGGGRLTDIGTTGGFLGHFIVVLQPPRRVQAGTKQAQGFQAIWPADTKDIWQICALESTRGAVGLSQINILVRREAHSGKLIIFGEVEEHGDLVLTDDEVFEIWQSPSELRRSLQTELVTEVVDEMMTSNGSWSMATAARAFFRSASSFSSVDKDELLKEIIGCWHADPICTSVVAIFWQRYICKLVAVMNVFPVAPVHPSDLILKCMPVKADRSLPGEILHAMQDCGWMRISRTDCSA